jgi:hypothetical protein
VPILPLAAPMIAVAIQRLRGAAGRALVVTTVAASLGVAIFSVAFAREQVLFSRPHGVAALAQAVEGSAPLDAALPTFTEEDWHAPLALLVRWLAAIVIAGATLGVLLRTRVVRSGFWAAAAGISAFGLFGSAAFARWAPADPSSAALRGQLTLIREFDSARLRAVDLSRWRRMNDGQLIAAVTISTTAGTRLDLPEGEYEARVTFRDGGPAPGERTGQALVALSRKIEAVSAPASGANPLVLPFTLWFDSPAAVDFSDAATAAAVSRIDVVPRRLVPRSARSGLSVVTAEGLAWKRQSSVDDKQQSYPAYVAYVDEDTFPEEGSYWTRDTRKGTVAIVPAGATALQLVLHVGPNAGRVSVDVGPIHQDVDMAPNETRDLRTPIAPGTRWLAVAVQASRGFVPADVDSGSDDYRHLGCQVRPLLQ